MDNLIELGFAQAGTGDALTSHAQTAMSLIVGFPENITEEVCMRVIANAGMQTIPQKCMR